MMEVISMMETNVKLTEAKAFIPTNEAFDMATIVNNVFEYIAKYCGRD